MANIRVEKGRLLVEDLVDGRQMLSRVVYVSDLNDEVQRRLPVAAEPMSAIIVETIEQLPPKGNIAVIRNPPSLAIFDSTWKSVELKQTERVEVKHDIDLSNYATKEDVDKVRALIPSLSPTERDRWNAAANGVTVNGSKRGYDVVIDATKIMTGPRSEISVNEALSRINDSIRVSNSLSHIELSGIIEAEADEEVQTELLDASEITAISGWLSCGKTRAIVGQSTPLISSYVQLIDRKIVLFSKASKKRNGKYRLFVDYSS